MVVFQVPFFASFTYPGTIEPFDSKFNRLTLSVHQLLNAFSTEPVNLKWCLSEFIVEIDIRCLQSSTFRVFRVRRFAGAPPWRIRQNFTFGPIPGLNLLIHKLGLVWSTRFPVFVHFLQGQGFACFFRLILCYLLPNCHGLARQTASCYGLERRDHHVTLEGLGSSADGKVNPFYISIGVGSRPHYKDKFRLLWLGLI